MVEQLRKPWLLLPSQLAHDLSPLFLKILTLFKSNYSYKWQAKEWRGLTFSNPLGIAGGVDKNGASVSSWWKFGPGFIEVGTVTPLPQGPNPGTIMDRNIPQKALWNKMGFPNKGLANLKKQLQKIPRPHYTPLFINVGKNRDTPLEAAAKDYIKCIEELEDYADAYVINISSPNTKGLRDLFEEPKLRSFLSEVISSTKGKVPTLLKLSPDLSEQELKRVLDVSYDCQIDGWILTNTTLEREPTLDFPEEGGVSGRPLSPISEKTLSNALDHLGPRRNGKLVVSCGGVLSADDVFQRLLMGADLVQVYSALVFSGPHFFRLVADKAKVIH